SRAVEIAGRYNIDLLLGSAFEPGEDTIGTIVTRKPERMEELVLAGIASKSGQAKLILRGLPPGLRTVAEVLVAVPEAGVSVDMISEAEETEGGIQLQLTLSEESLEEAERITGELVRGMGGGGVSSQRGLSRIALVGSGMHQRPGVYARAFRALLEQE